MTKHFWCWTTAGRSRKGSTGSRRWGPDSGDTTPCKMTGVTLHRRWRTWAVHFIRMSTLMLCNSSAFTQRTALGSLGHPGPFEPQSKVNFARFFGNRGQFSPNVDKHGETAPRTRSGQPSVDTCASSCRNNLLGEAHHLSKDCRPQTPHPKPQTPNPKPKNAIQVDRRQVGAAPVGVRRGCLGLRVPGLVRAGDR